LRKLVIHIFLLGFLAGGLAHSQGLNSSTGKINNTGTIRMKSGQVQLGQDTLLGRFEYLQDNSAIFYQVPNIVYGQLVIRNNARKFIMDDKDKFGNTRNLVVLDSLIMGNSATFTTFYIGVNPNDVLARSTVVNYSSQYNGPKDLKMQNDSVEQDLLSDGKFSRLNIDNPHGVNVKSGEFEVTEKLTLTRGELRNKDSANFKMKNETEIERHVGSSLAKEPKFEEKVNITYKGQGSMATSGETPTNKTTLKNMRVLNSDSLKLSRNVQVNDTLTVGGRIFALKDTLTLAHERNPEFLDPLKSEIGGTFKRNKFRTGEKVLFHNPDTYFIFADDASRKGIKTIVLDIRPTTFPKYDILKEKVYRSIDFEAFDESENLIVDGFNAEFGVGWRNALGEPIDEMNNLESSLAEIILQRWDGTDYEDLISNPAQNSPQKKWAYLNIATLNRIGSYAVGLSSINNISIIAKVILEGSYKSFSKGQMRTDLWNGRQGNLLVNNINPAQFPFSEMAGYDFTKITSVPDSVVDWIVLQFRSVNNPNIKFSKLLLVRYDGKLLDIDGKPKIKIYQNEFNPKVESNLFEVVVLHRNHSSIKTLNPIELRRENNKIEYDFTNPEFVFGGTASLKLVDVTDGGRVFGMKGGYLINDDISKSNMINVTNPFTQLKDYMITWNKLTELGYLIYDYNMDGIITTKDYNISWNNREE
jgi:hypothetical protein